VGSVGVVVEDGGNSLTTLSGNRSLYRATQLARRQQQISLRVTCSPSRSYSVCTALLLDNRMTHWDAPRMAVQIAVRLDDTLAENARAAAAAAGTNLSEWVRSAIRQQTALATALRARAEEDTGTALYTDEQEDTLTTARRRAAAAFDCR
jgi:hypothetical protein